MKFINVSTPHIYVLLKTVKQKLEDKRADIDTLINRYFSNEKLKNIWIGDWVSLSGYPCITLEPTGEDYQYTATNWTVEKEFVTTVNFYIQTPSTEVAIECISDIGELIHNILNDPKTVAWDVLDDKTGNKVGTVWESHASAKAYEYKEEGIRKVSITYTMQFMKVQC